MRERPARAGIRCPIKAPIIPAARSWAPIPRPAPQPISAELGCLQCVRDGRLRLPAECGGQSHRYGRGVGLLGSGSHHQPLLEIARPAGAGMKRWAQQIAFAALLVQCLAGPGPGGRRSRTMSVSMPAITRQSWATAWAATPRPAAGPLPAVRHLKPLSARWSPPNITPDEETGIGNWSEEEFRRAVKQGVSPGRQAALSRHALSRLCPDERCQCRASIWAYLQTVDPVRRASPANMLAGLSISAA